MKKNKDFSTLIKITEPLMTDRDREVHQGMGWFLREAWKVTPEPVENFLLKWKDAAPRLIIQYACEKMTLEQKAHYKKGK